MTAHVQQASILSGRSMTFMVVIGLHALFIAALIAVRIDPSIIDLGPKAIEVVNVPPDVTPPPPQPQPVVAIAPKVQVIVPLIDPPDFVVPPDSITVDAPTIDSGLVRSDAGPPTDGALTPPAPRVFTELAYRVVKSPDDYYPATSAALQEQGVAVVRLCVDGAGRMEGQPAIQTSSGYKRLDQAALKWAREALRFTAATENGVGVRSCKGFRVVFNLN